MLHQQLVAELDLTMEVVIGMLTIDLQHLELF